ncbi:unnamed protein product [Spirodela intermedia]|uniref:RRM domain-containing protein n=1 Tax=Spirodela intermedia TaxID=51605 RepID=A0A7I8J181_SPIIN|nr:unnamed protein product [Spirodela intermedia]CAA6663986.1 unnamed protein product [Spirodela intermedia]
MQSVISEAPVDLQRRGARFGTEGMQLPGSKPMIKTGEDFGAIEDEPFELSEEIEAQTIGDLLPGDDELLSGVIDDLEYIYQPNNGDDVEDDLFYPTNGAPNSQQGVLGVPFAGEHPYGEHPSRTLFVRNINSNVDDSELRTLFEQFGDIRNIYTACKHRGFVMISYYDIRSARNAMRALQNKPLRRRKLDIHFSIPKVRFPLCFFCMHLILTSGKGDSEISFAYICIHIERYEPRDAVAFNLDSSVSNDELRKIFGIYGEIKEIRETPHKHHHKFIEFYDVRAAEAALRALNRSDIAGKRIKLEPSRPGGTRRSSQQFPTDLDSEDANSCIQHDSPHNESTLGAYVSAPHGTITSVGVDTGPFQGVLSGIQGPVNPFMEGKFPLISSGQPLSSPIRVPSVVNHGNKHGPLEPTRSLGQMNFGFQSLLPIQSHSVSDFHDGVNRVGSLGSTNEGGNGGGCPLHGPHQYVWGNSNSYHPPPPPPPRHMVWSTSPSRGPITPPEPHYTHAPPPPPPPPAPPRGVGTCPKPISMGPGAGLRGRRRGQRGGLSTRVSGSTGFSGSPTPHGLELPSHAVFPHVGLPSPHMFHVSRSSMASSSVETAAGDRGRSRRGDAASSQPENKKQYELDIERIVRGEDPRTTLMIKNIPNKYTSKMLLASIDEHHRGTYDFIYLPIDFKNKCNVGYAFINMVDPQQIIPFFQTFNGKKWEKFNSEKVASLAYARIQGKSALIAHFQNSSLMNEDKRCRPILFHTDGPNAGDQEPFPMGINIRSRPGRPRPAANEDGHQESPSTSTNVEESSNGDASSGSTKDPEE